MIRSHISTGTRRLWPQEDHDDPDSLAWFIINPYRLFYVIETFNLGSQIPMIV